MVSLNDVQEANKLTFSHRPYVAVFVGATSGIGEYTISELARQLSGNSHEESRLYLIGRNTTAGDRVISECKTSCPGIEIIWIKAQDLALLADVDRICQEIRDHEKRRCADREPHIDLLFMTQGKVDFGDRSGTWHRYHAIAPESTRRLLTISQKHQKGSTEPCHSSTTHASASRQNCSPHSKQKTRPHT